ncbi:MAG: hypothetical protein QXS21_04935 [Thermoproteota archaeon]|nr:hypothetical protein [Candidatus Brockarchaeota archaeon]MBO3768131.1 hypothetical protein [Candidatus Brockarchaeota archaeon]MBO3801300.1 hypothetical protein [Candidatus Brockarchaeota archaeon]
MKLSKFLVFYIAFILVLTVYFYTFSERMQVYQVTLQPQNPFLILISPPVFGLNVNVTVLSGKSHILYISTNQTQVITSFILPPFSIIELVPNGVAYNLTLSFRSNKEATVYYGAFTYSPASDYPNYKYYRTGDGYFVPFSGITVPPGNFSISFLLNFLQTNSTSQQSIFGNLLPIIPGTIIFALISILSTYVEAFILVNAYFKNKENELSFQSKLLIFATIVGYLFLLYWSYSKFLSS